MLCNGALAAKPSGVTATGAPATVAAEASKLAVLVTLPSVPRTALALDRTDPSVRGPIVNDVMSEPAVTETEPASSSTASAAEVIVAVPPDCVELPLVL